MDLIGHASLFQPSGVEVGVAYRRKIREARVELGEPVGGLSMQVIKAAVFFILAVAVSVPQARGADNSNDSSGPQQDFCDNLLYTCMNSCAAAVGGSFSGAMLFDKQGCDMKCYAAYQACFGRPEGSKSGLKMELPRPPPGETGTPGRVKNPPTEVSPPKKPSRKEPGQVNNPPVSNGGLLDNDNGLNPQGPGATGNAGSRGQTGRGR